MSEQGVAVYGFPDMLYALASNTMEALGRSLERVDEDRVLEW